MSKKNKSKAVRLLSELESLPSTASKNPMREPQPRKVGDLPTWKVAQKQGNREIKKAKIRAMRQAESLRQQADQEFDSRVWDNL
jgi:hypothetical protein